MAWFARRSVVRACAGPAAAAAHFALMCPGDAILYKVLGIAPWPWKWSLEELAPDVLHKGLFVVATSAAYDHDVTIPRGQTT